MLHIAAFRSIQLCVPKNNPLFLLPPFTKLHLKFRYRNLNLINIKINQSINSTEQNNKLHKNIIINTISHFSISRKWLERVISNFRNITFCEKNRKHSTNQLSYVWLAHYCFSADSQVQSDSFAIFYNHNWLTYHQKDERFWANNSSHWKSNIVH